VALSTLSALAFTSCQTMDHLYESSPPGDKCRSPQSASQPATPGRAWSSSTSLLCYTDLPVRLDGLLANFGTPFSPNQASTSLFISSFLSACAGNRTIIFGCGTASRFTTNSIPHSISLAFKHWQETCPSIPIGEIWCHAWSCLSDAKNISGRKSFPSTRCSVCQFSCRLPSFKIASIFSIASQPGDQPSSHYCCLQRHRLEILDRTSRIGRSQLGCQRAISCRISRATASCI
jgi:hypothetical protein